MNKFLSYIYFDPVKQKFLLIKKTICRNDYIYILLYKSYIVSAIFIILILAYFPLLKSVQIFIIINFSHNIYEKTIKYKNIMIKSDQSF